MEKLREIYNKINWQGILTDPKIIGAAAVAVMAFSYIRFNRERNALDSKFQSQSVELPGPEKVRVNAFVKSLLDIEELEYKTIHELFIQAVTKFGDKPFLGTRSDANSPYEWESYKEIHDKAQYAGSGLFELGYRKGDFIGIIGINRPEWVIVDQGAIMFSLVLVPLYNTLGKEALQHILQQTELSILFTDLASLPNILDGNEETGYLKTVITLDKVTDKGIIERCISEDIKLLDFKEFLPPVYDDLALICYTSGTTGKPKGVMLSHKNLVTNAESFKFLETAVSQKDVYISYLPLSHMYERMGHYLAISGGAKIGFFRGNVKELIDDINVLRPTLFPAVPRVLNVIHDKIMKEISQSWFKTFLFKAAMNAKKSEISRGIIRRDSFWDKLVFRKIQQLLGGRVEAITSGAAPLSQSVKLFYKCAFGCMVFEGYGQTELTAMSNMTYALDPVIGHVGPPAACCRIKLVDVPDMDYFAKDGKGEICVQGSNVFQGYFKAPEKTAETIDEDGWCHTGDIGKWLSNGALSIIDRKKHIFKMAQGEYIAPEKVELVYLKCPLVSQIYVTGNSFQTFTVAIVCPDHEILKDWASKNHFTGSVIDLCKNENVTKAILEELREAGAAGGLNSLEQVKAVYLSSDGFTMENGLLTPTMKVKRNKVEEMFAAEIASLYNTKTMAQLSK